MHEKITIEKKEVRDKRLFIPVTLSEHKKIKAVCKNQKIKIADLVRYSLKQVIEL